MRHKTKLSIYFVCFCSLFLFQYAYAQTSPPRTIIDFEQFRTSEILRHGTILTVEGVQFEAVTPGTSITTARGSVETSTYVLPFSSFGNPLNDIATMTVRFPSPVNNLTYNVIVDNVAGSGVVHVYGVNEIFLGTKPILSDGAQSTKNLNSLKEFSNITKLVFSPNDPAGLGYDDFSFGEGGVSPVTAYYINGIRTDENSAALDYWTLRQALEKRFGGTLPASLHLAYVYNPTAGSFLDVVEATTQRFTQLNIGITQSVGAVLRTFSNQSEIIKNATRDVVLDLIQATPSFPVLNSHLEEYRRQVLSKDNSSTLILLGHSQGNYFANLSYAAFTNEEQKRTRVLAVATPASFTAGDGPHTTDLADIIQLIPTARKFNVKNTFNPITAYYLDWLGHNFRRFYLFPGFESEQKILLDFTNLMEGLQLQPQ